MNKTEQKKFFRKYLKVELDKKCSEYQQTIDLCLKMSTAEKVIDPAEITIGEMLSTHMIFLAIGGKPQYMTEVTNRIDGKVMDEFAMRDPIKVPVRIVFGDEKLKSEEETDGGKK